MKRMRDWLSKYQRPTVIGWQIWLKRQLKARGYFPDPSGDQFVREWTELLLKDANRNGPTDWKEFRYGMESSPRMIDIVIRDQAVITTQVALSRRHFLVIKYLGFF
jgi:hypothetical protein